MATKAPSPDFRSDKMDSLEGKAIARGRFLVFWDSIDPELLEETSTPSGVVCDALTEHLRQWPSDDLVFTAPDGGPVRLASWRSRFFKRAVDAAGVAPLRVHDLRHTAVSLCFAAGASPREIASRAGHTSVSIVLDRYGHLLPGSENRVNDELDRLAATALVAVPNKTTVDSEEADVVHHGEDEQPVALRMLCELSSPGTRFPLWLRYLFYTSNPSRRLPIAGTAVGCGEGSVLLGAVVADLVNPDDLGILRDLHGAGHDGHLDAATPPAASHPIGRPGERNRSTRVDDSCHRHSGAGRAGSAGPRCPLGGDPVAASLGVGGHQHAPVEDLDQAALDDDLHRFAGKGGTHPIAEAVEPN